MTGPTVNAILKLYRNATERRKANVFDVDILDIIRRDCIRELRKTGAPLRKIAELTGLSVTRVAQIIDGRGDEK